MDTPNYTIRLHSQYGTVEKFRASVVDFSTGRKRTPRGALVNRLKLAHRSGTAAHVENPEGEDQYFTASLDGSKWTRVGRPVFQRVVRDAAQRGMRVYRNKINKICGEITAMESEIAGHEKTLDALREIEKGTY